MKTVEIARKLAQLGQAEEARAAYELVIRENGDPAGIMEAALYNLESGGDYKISFDALIGLYQSDRLRREALAVMLEAFYEPNREDLKDRYKRNCRLLKKYPYLFRKDFPSFESLPTLCIPYDEEEYFAVAPSTGVSLRWTPFKKVITHSCFQDLDKPILATNPASQYELEYLRDNVRRSEDIARDNHIYFHYTDWGSFCSALSVYDMAPILADEKVVFLIEDELGQYPIDFKARFGIDYTRCTPRPVGVREVTRLIWHSQLSTHNGGDFFNEIFDGHPNLLALPSVMMEGIAEAIGLVRHAVETLTLPELQKLYRQFDMPEVFQELHWLHSAGELTDKDLMVACYMMETAANHTLDRNSRIAPAIFFQPHFKDIAVSAEPAEEGKAVLHVPAYEQLLASPMVQGFKYIKTFTPLRRVTTSYGASIKFMYQSMPLEELAGNDFKAFPDLFSVNDVSLSVYRLLNRTYLVDREDRLYTDCILVRFEDAKLNPAATFTALCAFLDLPYTESMTFCSENGRAGTPEGFSTAPVYRPYLAFAGPQEQFFFEYLFRDVYAAYGYDFHYYKGDGMDEARAEQLTSHFAMLEYHMRELRRRLYTAVKRAKGLPSPDALTPQEAKQIDDEILAHRRLRLEAAKFLLSEPEFVSPRGRRLELMPMLQPDGALLERELYH